MCVKGDMSLVGPRPLLMQYLERYTPEQARRHEVRPGITGLAQVNGRNALGWDEKFALDVRYVDHLSPSARRKDPRADGLERPDARRHQPAGPRHRAGIHGEREPMKFSSSAPAGTARSWRTSSAPRRRAGLAWTSTAFLDDNPRCHDALRAGSRVLGATRAASERSRTTRWSSRSATTDTRAQVFTHLVAGRRGAGGRGAPAQHRRRRRRARRGQHDLRRRDRQHRQPSSARTSILNTGARRSSLSHRRSRARRAGRASRRRGVEIGEGALIGIGAVVLPRVTIGAWSDRRRGRGRHRRRAARRHGRRRARAAARVSATV